VFQFAVFLIGCVTNVIDRAMSDRIYSAEQIEVPPKLPEILKAYTKEVIRFNPPDIVVFSRDYFTALADGCQYPITPSLDALLSHRRLANDDSRFAYV
jgi:hypothetical protein